MSKTIAAARGGSLAANGDADHSPAKVGFWALTLGCIGVVYGDIGTSPLYALRESVLAAVGRGHVASEPVVLGILSLIIWALLLVVFAVILISTHPPTVLFLLFVAYSLSGYVVWVWNWRKKRL